MVRNRKTKNKSRARHLIAIIKNWEPTDWNTETKKTDSIVRSNFKNQIDTGQSTHYINLGPSWNYIIRAITSKLPKISVQS